MMKTADLVENILNMELEMFLLVPSDGRSACQLNPEAFKFHRRLQFSVWSANTLSCYREDLGRAWHNRENLMTIKYARMQGLIPTRNTNPIIDAILRIKMDWQAATMHRYPAIMGSARSLTRDSDDQWMTSFETYARGELETYSDTTLASLHADFVTLQEKGINASEQVYRLQAEMSGFSSLESAEMHMRQQKERNRNEGERALF